MSLWIEEEHKFLKNLLIKRFSQMNQMFAEAIIKSCFCKNNHGPLDYERQG